MGDKKSARLIDDALYAIIESWYERVKGNYVTQEDAIELGVEPEIKRFHHQNHRIKFARKKDELDVTYGLVASFVNEAVYIESSVNNKSNGFDYKLFVKRLADHYWRSRSEKPWFEPDYDHYAYQDLLFFEPRMGETVIVESRLKKADIIRLLFEVGPRASELLAKRTDLFRDLIENYCLAPLNRIYAECYRA